MKEDENVEKEEESLEEEVTGVDKVRCLSYGEHQALKKVKRMNRGKTSFIPVVLYRTKFAL